MKFSDLTPAMRAALKMTQNTKPRMMRITPQVVEQIPQAFFLFTAIPFLFFFLQKKVKLERKRKEEEREKKKKKGKEGKGK